MKTGGILLGDRPMLDHNKSLSHRIAVETWMKNCTSFFDSTQFSGESRLLVFKVKKVALNICRIGTTLCELFDYPLLITVF
jgi:hypothetical protein